MDCVKEVIIIEQDRKQCDALTLMRNVSISNLYLLHGNSTIYRTWTDSVPCSDGVRIHYYAFRLY